MAYGLSFQPGGENGQSGPSGQKARVAPVQEAVRLLSLRLPSVVGARALAPQELLQSPGSAGLSGLGDMGVDAAIEWLRKQMRQSQASAPPQAESMFSSPGGGSADSPSQPPTSTKLPQPDRPNPQPQFAQRPGGLSFNLPGLLIPNISPQTGVDGGQPRPDSIGVPFVENAPPIYQTPVDPPPATPPADEPAASDYEPLRWWGDLGRDEDYWRG